MAVPPAPPLATVRPSGLTARAFTASPCPLSVPASAPVAGTIVTLSGLGVVLVENNV